MKTLLIAPCIVDTEERVQRYIKWLEYYMPLADKIGFSEILLIDNASPQENIDKLANKHAELISKYPINLHIIRKKVRIERFPPHGYGFWYRAMASGYKYALNWDYDKVIHIDSDAFIFTNKMCNWLKDIKYGWVSTYTKLCGFPECNIHVVAGRYNLIKAKIWMTEDFLEFYPNDIAEKRIPWTEVNKDFTGDRYPEFGKMVQEPEWDYCCQTPNEFEVKFRGD